MFPFSFKCSLDFPNVPLEFQCVHLSSQVFPYVPMGSHDFPWVSKCSLEFPCVPLSFLEFTSVPLSSQMFPLSGTFVSCCMNRGCLLGVWMIPFLSKCGTFVAWCMNRGCLLGIEWFHFCQMVQCSPLVSSVPLISQMFPLISNVFTWVLKCSIMFPWVPLISLEFPSVPLSFLEFTSFPLNSDGFPMHAEWTSL